MQAQTSSYILNRTHAISTRRTPMSSQLINVAGNSYQFLIRNATLPREYCCDAAKANAVICSKEEDVGD